MHTGSPRIMASRPTNFRTPDPSAPVNLHRPPWPRPPPPRHPPPRHSPPWTPSTWPHQAPSAQPPSAQAWVGSRPVAVPLGTYPPLLSPSRSSWPLAAKPCPLLRLLASRFLCWPPDKPCQPSWPLDTHLGPSPDQLAPHHPLGPLQAHLGPSLGPLLPLLLPCRSLGSFSSLPAPCADPLGPSPPL